MRKVLKKFNKNCIYSLTVVWLIWGNYLLINVNAIVNSWFGATVLDTLIYYGVMAILCIASAIFILCNFRTIKRDVFIVVGGMAIFYIWSAVFVPELRPVMMYRYSNFFSNPTYCLLVCLFIYVLVRQIDKFSVLFKYSLRVSYILIAMCWIEFFSLFTGYPAVAAYLDYSETLLISSSVAYYYCLMKKNNWQFVLLILNIVPMYLIGARGSVLLYMVLPLVCLIFDRQKKNVVRNLLAFVTFAIFVSVVTLNVFDIGDVIQYKLKFVNITSRTLTMAQNNQILDPNSRSELWMMGLEALPENIVLGQGLFGDRVVTYNTGLTRYPYMYVHNLFIELMVQFGVILGIVLSLIIIYIFFKSLFLSRNSFERTIVMFLLPAGVGNLMFSFSYTLHRSFWLVLAIAVGVVFAKKKECKSVENMV